MNDSTRMLVNTAAVCSMDSMCNVSQHYYGAFSSTSRPLLCGKQATQRGETWVTLGGWAPTAIPTDLVETSPGQPSPPTLTRAQLTMCTGDRAVWGEVTAPPGCVHQSQFVAKLLCLQSAMWFSCHAGCLGWLFVACFSAKLSSVITHLDLVPLSQFYMYPDGPEEQIFP